MKRLLIVSHCMELGGAERALLGLLGKLNYDEYNVDLFLLRHTGELLKFIPEKVNLLPENKYYSSLAVDMKTVIKNKAFLVGLGRFSGKRAADKFFREHDIPFDINVLVDYSHRYTKRFMPMISDTEYDAAVSFLTPHYFVAEKVRAKRKIAWIHTDYSSVKLDIDGELKMWSAFDNIIAISDTTASAFIETFPSLKNRISIIENIHPAEFIRKSADEFSVKNEMPDDGYIKFLSVGRYCTAKNFDNIPDICSRIPNVKWYIIGFGPDEDLIKKKIAEKNMQNRVILLGKKENPYPYFKECDFYIQPSRYEGNAVTVNEALILGKLVAVTDYPTASSQINNYVDGIIVPLENDECARALSDFISDTKLQQFILENLAKTDYSKSDEIIKIQKVVDYGQTS